LRRILAIFQGGAAQQLDWNKFKLLIPFANRNALTYLDKRSAEATRSIMIVCSCNVLSDTQVRSAIADAAPRSAVHVHRCLGCSAQCGRCIRTIKRIMDEALAGACPPDCACCQHSADASA
jgi:bacterioferritin-associated ferredoxin